MFHHILVPVDLGDQNQQALDVAVDLARPNAARITLFHVIETIADVPRRELSDFYDSIEAQAQKTLADLVDALEDVPDNLGWEIVYGRRVREILKRVRQDDIDLLVLHSHRVRRDDPAHGLGTLSHEVAILADCPVLLVK